jgi:hypothetical protein
MRVRPLLAVAAVGLAGATTILAGVSRADAASVAPTAQAWWSVANNGAPGAPAPGVAARDLLVAGSKGDQSLPSAGRAGAPSPFSNVGDKGAATALAAVRYSIPAGQAVDRLVLRFDSGAQSSVSMAACRITGSGDFKAEQAGPWSDVPAYDCTTPSLGSLTPDGTAVQFTDVGGLANGSVLSVVVVPQYAAYSVLLPPGPDSLVLRAAPAPYDAGSPPPAFVPSADSSGGTSGGSDLPPAALSVAPITVPPPQAAAPAPPEPAATPAVPRTPPTTRPAQPAVAMPGLDDARARLASGFGLAAMLAAFAWLMAGDAPRLRRLLAARLAGPGVTLPQPTHTRGVGRFRRERVGRPPEV